MADTREDDPNNKGLKGLKSNAFGPDGVVPIFGQELVRLLNKNCLSSALVTSSLVMMPLLGGIAAGVEYSLGDVSTYNVAVDAQIEYGFDNENGYYAVSDDEGLSGYVLVEDAGQYKLYSFVRGRKW